MYEISALEAQETLNTLLDRVARGEEVVITRDGTPVARLVPSPGNVDPFQIQAALMRIREVAENSKPGHPEVETTKEKAELD
jgi:prevent-host-death family protein